LGPGKWPSHQQGKMREREREREKETKIEERVALYSFLEKFKETSKLKKKQ
jgi:hypothetical protein